MTNFSPYLRTLMLRKVFTPDFTPTMVFDNLDPLSTGVAVELLDGVQIALTTQVPLVNAAVEDLVEPMEGNYSRAAYPLNADSWYDNGFGQLCNTDTIFFPVITTTWGRISGWAMIDPSAHQVLVTGEMTNPFITTIGMVPTIDSGVITLG